MEVHMNKAIDNHHRRLCEEMRAIRIRTVRAFLYPYRHEIYVMVGIAGVLFLVAIAKFYPV